VIRTRGKIARVKIEPSDILRWVCVIVVAGVFVLAGVGKVMNPDEAGTMVGRYLKSPETIRAVGFCEVGLALWLISAYLQRFAMSVGVGVLVAFTLMIGVELQRSQPLPCGCLEATPGQMEPHAVRRGLWVSIGRNGVLVGLSVVAILLIPPGRGTRE
jgi:uncharacterized membrane protein YphA (DoxX/SURF4 family)